MAEVISDSDSDGEVNTRRPNPPPKRRRIIDASAITSVPIYSNKVNSSLQLKPFVFKPADFKDDDDDEEAKLWSPSKNKNTNISVTLSDSDEEPEREEPREVFRSPSPPPDQTFKPTKRADKKIREINKKLNEIGSLLCPSPEREAVPECTDSPSPSKDYNDDDDDDEDIIIVSSSDKQKKQSSKRPPRERSRQISLKFRWRTDVYKIPVLSTDPLSKAVDQLSVKIKAPPSQILLLRKDTELPVNSTVSELDLGIADIIDCVVDNEEGSKSTDVITVRLQGKEKGSAQEYSLHKDAPLGSVLSQYVAGLSATAKRKVKFLFDGSKVTHNQTPFQLDMEDGDVIEVWM